MRKLEAAPSIDLSKLSPTVLNLLRDDAVIELMNRINNKYHYWDKVKHEPTPEGVTNEDIWRISKIRRLNTVYKIKFGKYTFHWNLTSQMHEWLHFLDLNIGGSLESSSIINKEDKTRYLLSSVMEEAIASSQIEGAVTTRKVAKEMLRKNKKPANKSEQMIYNNYITINRILELKNEPITKQLLLDVHLLVTSKTLSDPEEEGMLRKDNDINVVDMSDGEIVHSPPDNEEIEGLIEELFIFFNNDDPSLFIHPIVKACIIHFMIGFIHPFSDGNGRTARALFYWYLIRKGYWLVEYMSISRLILKSKAQYARAFQYTEIDDNDMTYFLLYNLKTMRLAFIELREYIARKNEQQRKFNSFTGIDGITHKESIILEWFLNEPNLILTVRECETRLGVSSMSARNYIYSLVDKDYLSSIQINKVTKGYIMGSKLNSFKSRSKPTYSRPTTYTHRTTAQQNLFSNIDEPQSNFHEKE